jgi:hypothetical protein
VQNAIGAPDYRRDYIAFKEKMKIKKYRKPRVKTQLKILAQLHRWLKKLKLWNARKELVDLANEKIEHHERYLEIAIAREVGNDDDKIDGLPACAPAPIMRAPTRAR